MHAELLCTMALQVVRSFETELQLLKNLRHERIVMYYGTERTDGKLHICFAGARRDRLGHRDFTNTWGSSSSNFKIIHLLIDDM